MQRVNVKIPPLFGAVDACVVDEQPAHIVVQIRLPRETITNNLHFLAGLAEVSCSPLPPPLNMPAMGQKRPYSAFFAKWATRPTLAKIAVGAALCATVLLAPQLKASATPPLTILELRLLNPVVTDGHLHFETYGHRSRICSTVVERVIKDDAGYTIHASHQNGIGRAVTAAPERRFARVKLPTPMKPGAYTYHSIVISTCPEGRYILNNPEVAFRVE